MTPTELAMLHALCFDTPRPWSAAEFDDLCASKFCFVETCSDGFILGRVIADEAELLTLAVNPSARRQGHGRRLVDKYHATAQKMGAADSFLEVAAENLGAIGLYSQAGYEILGTRPKYYTHPDGHRTDAKLMRMPINQP